jgi:hypothetical protein
MHKVDGEVVVDGLPGQRLPTVFAVAETMEVVHSRARVALMPSEPPTSRVAFELLYTVCIDGDGMRRPVVDLVAWLVEWVEATVSCLRSFAGPKTRLLRAP